MTIKVQSESSILTHGLGFKKVYEWL